MKESVNLFFNGYLNNFVTNIEKVSLACVSRALFTVEQCILNNGTIYICGNGGSAAIADHFVCDFMKGLSTDTSLKVKIFCLNSNMPIYSAISNDLSFEKVFSYQINALCSKDDILITVSSSGNSQNIIEAIHAAKSLGLKTISLSGFGGGRSVESDIHINVPASNYGVIEDAHHFLLHMMVQYLRVRHSKNKSEIVL